jgi:hypothetical protein
MKISRIYADTKDRKVSKTLQTLKITPTAMFVASLVHVLRKPLAFCPGQCVLVAVLAAPCILLREGSQKV